MHPLAKSYWEEQWRNLHNNGTALKESDIKSLSYKRSLKQSLSQRLGLSRTESDPSPVKVVSVNNDTENSVRRCLLNSYLHKVVQSSEVIGKFEQDKFPIVSIHKEIVLSFERSSQLKIKADNENLIVTPPSVAKFSPHINSPVKHNDESSAERTDACCSGKNSLVLYTARAGNEHENCHDNDSEDKYYFKFMCRR